MLKKLNYQNISRHTLIIFACFLFNFHLSFDFHLLKFNIENIYNFIYFIRRLSFHIIKNVNSDVTEILKSSKY